MNEMDVDHLILRIGEYQLRNLLANRVGFHFFDLSEGNAPAVSALLESGLKIAPTALLAKVRAEGYETNAPIVLICENGVKSLAAARQLARESFINVFVVEGGIAAL